MMERDALGFLADKRLVILGAGYVGLALAQAARDHGVRVSALTRNAEKAATLAADGVEVVLGDLATGDWHSRLSPEADFIVNCVSSGGGGIDGYRRSYLEGQRSIIRWAAAARRPGTFVYTSSTTVYPQKQGERVVESAPTDGSEESARIMVESEEVARQWPGRAFILRLAGIYGPDRHHLLDQLKAKAGALGGRGEHHLNLIHRDDIVAAIWSALTAPAALPGATFNVADDGAAPKFEVVAWLAGQLGQTPPPFTNEPTGGRRAIVPDRVIANDLLRSTLGWKPRYPTFREGYAQIFATEIC